MTGSDLSLAHRLFDLLEPSKIAPLLLQLIGRQNGFALNADPSLLDDTQLLRSLGADELVKNLHSQRSHTMYFTSFVLRHSLCWVAFSVEKFNRPVSVSFPFENYSPFQHHMGTLFQKMSPYADDLNGLALSLSARGLEWIRKKPGLCRYFEPYLGNRQCSRTSALQTGFCSVHEGLAWPLDSMRGTNQTSPTGIHMRHQTMLHFYSDFRNLRAFSEAELDRMTTTFFRKLADSQFSSGAARSQAAQLLGFDSWLEVAETSDLLLKTRYRELVRRHHPDTGGSSEEFQKIHEAYKLVTAERST